MELCRIRKRNGYVHLKIRIKKYLAFFPVLAFLIGICCSSYAGNPAGAYYSRDNSNLFWFVLISDTHIGAETRPLDPLPGCTDMFSWMVINAYNVIRPQFIVNLGDLTDQLETPYNNTTEWKAYIDIANLAGMGELNNGVPVYIDAPGNHDQYWEGTWPWTPLGNYEAYSIQGRAINNTQQSWVYDNPNFGKYHFITIATPDPAMTKPLEDSNNGCVGELSIDELYFT